MNVLLSSISSRARVLSALTLCLSCGKRSVRIVSTVPQTHALIKALARASWTRPLRKWCLITESNVPFEDNISRIWASLMRSTGMGDEAQLVYQFSLGPLVLHALISGNARVLIRLG